MNISLLNIFQIATCEPRFRRHSGQLWPVSKGCEVARSCGKDGQTLSEAGRSKSLYVSKVSKEMVMSNLRSKLQTWHLGTEEDHVTWCQCVRVLYQMSRPSLYEKDMFLQSGHHYENFALYAAQAASVRRLQRAVFVLMPPDGGVDGHRWRRLNQEL